VREPHAFATCATGGLDGIVDKAGDEKRISCDRFVERSRARLTGELRRALSDELDAAILVARERLRTD